MSTPTGFRDRVVCPHCGYENGGWRSICESCEAPLRQSSAGLTLTTAYGEERKGVPAWRWVLFVLGMLRVCVALARCSNANDQRSPILYEPSAQPLVFDSPLSPLAEDPGWGVDPFRYGSDTFASSSVTLTYPLLWHAYQVEPNRVQLEGLQEYLEVSWEENDKMTNTELLALKASAPELFQQLVAQEIEQNLRTQLTREGGILTEFVQHEHANVGHLEVVVGVYEANMIVDTEQLHMSFFVTVCPVQRLCTFKFGRADSRPLNVTEWETLARIADSLQFADAQENDPGANDQAPTPPTSPLPKPQSEFQAAINTLTGLSSGFCLLEGCAL